MTWAALIVATVGLAVGLLLFEPWKAFTSSELNEASPSVARVLGGGDFVSQEHETSGRAEIVAAPDGTRVLRLTGLSSSDGPDLHVWLTDAEAGSPDWHVYDDGRHVPLGELKATHGNHNYEIPRDVDLAGLTSAVIWCDRFNVAFGSAPLT